MALSRPTAQAGQSEEAVGLIYFLTCLYSSSYARIPLPRQQRENAMRRRVGGEHCLRTRAYGRLRTRLT